MEVIENLFSLQNVFMNQRVTVLAVWLAGGLSAKLAWSMRTVLA